MDALDAARHAHQHALGEALELSKAFAYCLALELNGRETVGQHVGAEPSGDVFNAIIFDDRTNWPSNPMVNAGVITVASVIHQHAGSEAMALRLDRLSRAAGRPLSVPAPVDVGVPAKSGVGGGIVGAVNRQIGMGGFSPRLDSQGNSVRGLAAFRSLSDELGLHAFECTNTGSEYLRVLS